MRKSNNRRSNEDQRHGGASARSMSRNGVTIVATLLAALGSNTAFAFELVNESGLSIRWDNTVKYTLGSRLKSADATVANQNNAQPNTDFGDLGHDKGIVNNRFDLLTEFDAKYKNVGFRISGAAWNDSMYTRRHNDFSGVVPNTQAAVLGGANNRIPKDTRDVMGRHAEVMDAFVYGNVDLDDHNLSLRAGKHSLLYGESLFLGMNGIAAAQGPVDIIKALSLPNTQFKEIALPVRQLSGSFSITPTVSIGAYYQYQWRANRVPAAGSYFSAADFVGDGADLLIHPFSGFGPFALSSPLATRDSDLEGNDRGQWGAQLKFRIGDVDYGLYAANYDDKNPIPVLNAASVAARAGGLGGGSYRLMYARDISVYGGSFSTVLGETNVAGEISTRRNVPLAVPGDLIINSNFVNPNADNETNTPYARGNSLHANFSAISLFGGNGFWGGASLVGELAYNRLLGVTHQPTVTPGFPNPLNPNRTRDSAAMRVVFTPEFFQVLPNVDLQLPIGLGYGLFGRSAVVQMSPEHGGDFSVGLNATIDRVWKVGLTIDHFFGKKGTAVDSATGTTPTSASYQQYFRDRDFVALTIQSTF